MKELGMKKVLAFPTLFLMLVSCVSSPAEQAPVPTLSHPFTPTAKVIQSAEPTLTPTIAPTGIALSSIQNDYALSGEGKYLSPGGEWQAFTDNGFETAHVLISRVDGSKSWDLSFQDITGASSCVGYTDQYGDQRCFYGVLHINHWYKNGRYVFVDADYLIDRSTNFSFGLYRIDSETGKVSPYLPLNGSAYTYAFSPDDENYSYATSSDNYLLHVVTIKTGENTSYVVPGRYEDIGEMLWSPDNKKLAIATHGIGWNERPDVGWALVLLDVETGKITTLIPNEGYKLTPTKWLSGDQLLLSGWSKDGQGYHDYQLLIPTNTLLPLPDVTPTP